MRNRFVACLGIGLPAALVAAVVGMAPAPLDAGERAAATARPNVLFIAVDDLGDDVGLLGFPDARTPELDAFARSARVFTHHYVQVPTCGASRAVLFSGRYPTSPAGLDNSAIRATHDEWRHASLPAAFRAQGYRTLALGKVTHHPGGLTGKDRIEVGHDPGDFSIRTSLPIAPPALAALRAIVAEDAEAAALAKAIAAEAAPLIEARPQPLAEIHYEGLVNTDPRRVATVARLREMDGVALLIQHWQASGAARAAATLDRFVDAWAATYRPTGNDVNENKLWPLFVAWHALRSGSGAEHRARIDAWFTDLGERHAEAVKTSQHLTNRYTKHVRLAVLAGLATGREEWVALGRAGVERFVRASLRADGSSLDLERRDSLTYHCSALVPALDIALLLGDEGRELYAWTAPEGGSLKRSVDFVVPYATGEKTRREWVNSTVELDRRRAAAGVAHYQPGMRFEPKDATSLIEAASAFDQTLLPVYRTLSSTGAERYPGWRMLVQAALRRR